MRAGTRWWRIVAAVVPAFIVPVSSAAQPAATPGVTDTLAYVGHAAGIVAEIPTAWTLDRAGRFHYAGLDGGVTSGAYGGNPFVRTARPDPLALEDACAGAAGTDRPAPAVTAWNGTRACTLRDVAWLTWHLDMLLFEHPQPAADGANRLAFVMVDQEHFAAVVASISFDLSQVTAGRYLATAIDAMEAASVWRDLVDWPALRGEAMDLLGAETASRTLSAAWPAIELVLARLAGASGDGHHRLEVPSPLPPAAPSAITLPVGSIPQPGVGMLVLPGLAGTPEQATDYVVAAHEAITAGAAADACGWIVDLRPNSGGNMYPMIGAVAPLLPPGVGIGFRDVHGDIVAVSYDGGGQISYDGRPYPIVFPFADGDATVLASQPVAVLIGPGTASAGEATAVVLAGRDATQYFGQATADMATAPDGLRLIDGAVIVLATTRYVGPNGATYDDGIVPDAEVFDAYGGTDDVVTAAIAWLHEQPGCVGRA